MSKSANRMPHKPLPGEEDEYIPMPESYTRRQLNALYREIPLKDTTFRTLRKYFDAMAILYGVIPLRKALEIIQTQNPNLVTEAEFCAFAAIARHEFGYYRILGEHELIMGKRKKRSPLDLEIIDLVLLDNGADTYCEVKRLQQGKPYYIPDKEELLRYADVGYFDETPELAALRAFLIDTLALSDDQAMTFLEDLVFSARCLEDGLQESLNQLASWGVTFRSDAEFQRFTALYQDFNNAARLPCNRGYTPNELVRRYSSPGRPPQSISFGPNIRKMLADGTMNVPELRNSILSADLPDDALRLGMLKELSAMEKTLPGSARPPKVGRNDPCPCGSGKKYKHCCGRVH